MYAPGMWGIMLVVVVVVLALALCLGVLRKLWR